MAALGWLLAGGALLLLPARAPVPSRAGSRPDDRPSGDPAARRPALTVAVLAAGTGVVALCGPVVGLPLAVVGCPAVALGLRWLAGRESPSAPDDAIALVLDLAAAALRSGRPLADALTLAAPAARADTGAVFLRVAGLSRLGADPAQAWAAVPRAGPLGEVAAVAVRSATSGIKLASGFERLAVELRAERRAAAAVRAHRAGVRAMGPLAACFLPSFVCLGIVPVVVGVAKNALDVLP